MSEATRFPIRIAEELILLMLDEQSGYLEMVPNWNFSCVMAGAVLADLALERRIETDLERLYLVDPTPTGDELLDPTLKDIAESAKNRTLSSGSNGTPARPTKSSRPPSSAWWSGTSLPTRAADSGGSRARSPVPGHFRPRQSRPAGNPR